MHNTQGFPPDSLRATKFRIWSTSVIKELLLTSDQATDLFDVIRDYTYALDTLDAYDYQSLKIADTTAPGAFRTS